MKLSNLYAVSNKDGKIISLHETKEGAQDNIVNHILEEEGLHIINPVIHK